jgi:hypothetical protein
VVLVVIRAVHPKVLRLPDTCFKNWILAIDSFLRQHDSVVQEKFGTIISQVTVIVEEIKNRNLISIGGTWKFSSEEAHVLAEWLAKCVEDNLM